MSATALRSRLRAQAIGAGWHELSSAGRDDRRLHLYRWASERPLTRIELVITFDSAGRVQQWSEWRNTRTDIDGKAGTRPRLEIRIAAVADRSEQ